jgi:YD repeat-containing protein
VVMLVLLALVTFNSGNYSIAMGLQKNHESAFVGSRDKIDLSIDSNKVEKELIAERTLFSKKYLQVDGQIREEFSLVPMHYQDNEDQYQDVNTKITSSTVVSSLKVKPSKDTYLKYNNFRKSVNSTVNKTTKTNPEKLSYSAYQVPFDSDIPMDIISGYSIGKDQEKITIIPLNAKSSIGVMEADNKIRYKDVWKNVDLELEITNIGIKENIIIKNKNAPKTFKFKIQKSSDNLKNLLILPSYLIDSKDTYRSIETKEENNGDITVSYDDKGLSYPITIDPTTTILPVWAYYVDARYPDQSFSFEQSMKVGYEYGQKISYLQYHLPESFRDVTINSAKLQLYANFKYGSDTNINVSSYKVEPPINGGIGLTYNSRPQENRLVRGEVVNISKIAQYYTFDVTPIVHATLSTKLNVQIGLYGDSTGGMYGRNSGIVQFATPWNRDQDYYPKLIMTYNNSATPIITGSSTTVNIDGSVRMDWNVQEVSGRTQSKFEIAKLPLVSNSSTFYEADRVSISSPLKTYLFSTVSSGVYRFAIRSFNGLDWSEWYYTEKVTVPVSNKYVVDSANRLKKIENNDGEVVGFTYDRNGNLLNKSVVNSTNIKKFIADGNPMEWAYNNINVITDNYDDFFNTSLETKEPERDIRSVYYKTDDSYLYVMLELGRTKDYEILYPHGYDNDNYFIYLTSDKPGVSATRNKTYLKRAVSYEIASWHNDNITVHSYNPSTNSWKWDWTGSFTYDGIKSVKVIKEETTFGVFTSAILEMRIPLVYIPNVDLNNMIIVAGSDKYDMDMASN